MSEWNLTDAAEQWITCPYCDAQPGERCRTSGGRFTTPHSYRLAPLMAAWRDGYTDGHEDGIAAQKRRTARP